MCATAEPACHLAQARWCMVVAQRVVLVFITVPSDTARVVVEATAAAAAAAAVVVVRWCCKARDHSLWSLPSVAHTSRPSVVWLAKIYDFGLRASRTDALSE